MAAAGGSAGRRLPAAAPTAPAGLGGPRRGREPEHHLAVWLPARRRRTGAPPGLEPAPLARAGAGADGRLGGAVHAAGRGRRRRGDEGLGRRHAPGAAVHVRRGGATAHRGAARNGLLERSDEPFLAVLDGGDELIGDALERMADLLRDDPGLDAALCPATYGDTLVNVLLPDEQRLRQRIYLTRGYVVRRSTLEALGGFTEDPELADRVDHHFWLSLTARGGRPRCCAGSASPCGRRREARGSGSPRCC